MATITEPTILSRWTVDLVEKMPHIEGERHEIIATDTPGRRRADVTLAARLFMSDRPLV